MPLEGEGGGGGGWHLFPKFELSGPKEQFFVMKY